MQSCRYTWDRYTWDPWITLQAELLNLHLSAGFCSVQIPDIAYWDYNANSGDTGGIVDDSWVNVLWVKINWLIATVNLSPWYLGATVSSAFLSEPLSKIKIWQQAGGPAGNKPTSLAMRATSIMAWTG